MLSHIEEIRTEHDLTTLNKHKEEGQILHQTMQSEDGSTTGKPVTVNDVFSKRESVAVDQQPRMSESVIVFKNDLPIKEEESSKSNPTTTKFFGTQRTAQGNSFLSSETVSPEKQDLKVLHESKEGTVYVSDSGSYIQNETIINNHSSLGDQE